MNLLALTVTLLLNEVGQHIIEKVVNGPGVSTIWLRLDSISHMLPNTTLYCQSCCGLLLLLLLYFHFISLDPEVGQDDLMRHTILMRGARTGLTQGSHTVLYQFPGG